MTKQKAKFFTMRLEAIREIANACAWSDSSLKVEDGLEKIYHIAGEVLAELRADAEQQVTQ
jgi:hypothetical protein